MRITRIDIDHAAVARLGSHPPIDRDFRVRAHRVRTMADVTAPRDTGHYAGSIGVSRLEPHGYRVTAEADHARFVEWDTRPHEIRPRVAKALWWPGAGHPRAQVNHPGTTGQHIMSDALSQAHGRSHV